VARTLNRASPVSRAHQLTTTTSVVASLVLLRVAVACEDEVASTWRRTGDTMRSEDGGADPPEDAGGVPPALDAGGWARDAGASTPDTGVPTRDAGRDAATDGDPLGPCTGTDNECLAARLINEYRAGHVNEGECNHPLRWDEHLGRLAHEHQSGPFVRHSSHGYIENVGNELSVEGAVEWLLEYTPGVEDHCARDGSYVASHHCAGMYCNNHTIGVGVYEGGGRIYMTMMFGDERGEPGW